MTCYEPSTMISKPNLSLDIISMVTTLLAWSQYHRQKTTWKKEGQRDRYGLESKMHLPNSKQLQGQPLSRLKLPSAGPSPAQVGEPFPSVC